MFIVAAGLAAVIAAAVAAAHQICRMVGNMECVQRCDDECDDKKGPRCFDEDRNRRYGIRKKLPAKKAAGTKKFTDHTDQSQCDCKAKPHAKAVKQRKPRTDFVCVGFCTSEDDAVYNDQRDINAECGIKPRCVGLQKQIDDCHK